MNTPPDSNNATKSTRKLKQDNTGYHLVIFRLFCHQVDKMHLISRLFFFIGFLVTTLAQFQPQLPYTAFPCDLSYNTTAYPTYIMVEATDLAGNVLNTTGVFEKTDSVNGYPAYRKPYLYLEKAQPRLLFPDQESSTSTGVLRNNAQNIFLNNLGQWELVEDRSLTGHISQELPCTSLLNTTAHWQFSSNTGVTMQIKLNIKPLVQTKYPDFYQISSAPLQLEGFYKKTAAFQSAAPMYKKPGVGNMQNYLFLYKGSWMVARDPMATPLSYRMYQLSQNRRTPDNTGHWMVVTNNGSVEENKMIKTAGIMQMKPLSFTITSTGRALKKVPRLMGQYQLTNITNNNIPVYQDQATKQYLFQNTEGSWVVATSLTATSTSTLLSQDSKGSPLPSTTIPWRFYSNGWHTDEYLTAVPEISPETKAARLRLTLSLVFPILAVILAIIIVISIICCFKKKKARDLLVKNQKQPATLRKISQL